MLLCRRKSGKESMFDVLFIPEYLDVLQKSMIVRAFFEMGSHPKCFPQTLVVLDPSNALSMIRFSALLLSIMMFFSHFSTEWEPYWINLWITSASNVVLGNYY